jgi:hypothetical protein
MELKINNRIREIRETFCSDSNKEFAAIIKEKQNTVNNWIREGYSIGVSVICKVLTAFPEINPTWLLTGEGEMLKTTASPTVSVNDAETLELHRENRALRKEVEQWKNEAAELRKQSENNERLIKALHIEFKKQELKGKAQEAFSSLFALANFDFTEKKEEEQTIVPYIKPMDTYKSKRKYT